MRELTDEEISRLDFVHGAIHQLLCKLAGQNVPWDVGPIGEISDIAEQYVCETLGIMTPAQFAPYIEHTRDDD
jgi:hypothetical protein